MIKSLFSLFLVCFVLVSQAQSFSTIEEQCKKIELDFSIACYFSHVPSSVWELDMQEATHGEYKNLYRYMLMFHQEFSLYPKSFIKKVNLGAVVFVKNLGYGGQLRAAIPDYTKEILYFDFMRGIGNKTYQRHVMHHEFYHMIEQEFNASAYWKDPEWRKLNTKQFNYGQGGASVQSNSNAYSFSHPAKGFVNLYAQSGLEEDKAEIFAGLFIVSEYDKIKEWSKQDKILLNKMLYIKKFLKEIDEKFKFL